MKKSKVVVAGSFIVDVVGFAPRFPKDGETVIGSTVKFGPGGKGSNQATAASRAGAEAIMITKIGVDVLSNIAIEHYNAEGMSQKYVYRTDKAPTGTAFIEVSETTGENRIIVVKGANELLSAVEVAAAEEEIATCDAVLAQLESSDEAIVELFRLAMRHGKRIILNPAPARQVPEGLFEVVDYLTPNETEAEYFSGVPVKNPEDAGLAAEKLLGLGVKNVIITLGKHGAFYSDGNNKLLVPTTDLKAVDTTGAGDAFCGALAVALSEGMDILRAIRFANCAASISVTRAGTSQAMPYRHEINELYARFYGN
ncbi:MAG TPA: ribokinase [Bacillota bacterium]|nr:ribokinase [Clostridiales bacterium]HPT86092.1 ribokinase [Bacillota bacterium]